MQLLLDQMHRPLFRRVGKRWYAAFFDPPAPRFASDLDPLPAEQTGAMGLGDMGESESHDGLLCDYEELVWNSLGAL